MLLLCEVCSSPTFSSSPFSCGCHCCGSAPGQAFWLSHVSGQAAAQVGFGEHLWPCLKSGEGEICSISHCPCTEGRLCETSDNAGLMRTVQSFCPSVVLLMLRLEFLSYSGNTEGMWCVFQYVNVPRSCLQRAADLGMLGSYTMGSQSSLQGRVRWWAGGTCTLH